MKILINAKYNNDPTRSCRGIAKNSELFYNENGFKVKITPLEDRLLISKENNEYKVIINLCGNNSFIEYKGAREGNISLRLEEVSYQVNENSISFSYVVENNNKINCEIKYEVIE